MGVPIDSNIIYTLKFEVEQLVIAQHNADMEHKTKMVIEEYN